MSPVDWFYAALIAVALTVAGFVITWRAIDAPDKGRHATPREDRDGAPTAAWLRSLHGIPPMVLARVHVAAYRAALAGATAPLPVQAGPARVDGPVPAPPGPARPEWTGDIDDTGWLPRLTDWALNAPADEVHRAV